jgi:hypothetical protein
MQNPFLLQSQRALAIIDWIHRLHATVPISANDTILMGDGKPKIHLMLPWLNLLLVHHILFMRWQHIQALIDHISVSVVV